MGLISIPGGLYAPPVGFYSAAISSTALLDAATKRFAFILRVPKQGTLDKFEIRTGITVGLNPSSSIKFSFQDVNVALDPSPPDGSIDQFRNVAGSGIPQGAWFAPGLLTSDGTDTGTKRNVNKNELLALVVEYQIFDTGDLLSFGATVGPALDSANAGLFHFPHELNFDGSIWAFATNARIPIVALKYSDGTYAFISPEVPPISTSVDVAFNNASTPDERGVRFKFPFPVRVSGAWLLRNHLSAGAYDIVLYDSNGTTVIETVVIDPDQVIEIASNEERLYVRFSADRDLLKDTYYRLAIKPTSVTDTRYLAIGVNSVAHMSGLVGGPEWHATSRTDAGAWTETLTEYPLMGLHIGGVEEFQAGGGGGGGFVAVSRGFKRGMI